MKFYIDEAGNSGSNLLDKNQKYFTIGAFGIEKEKQSIFETNLKEIFKYIPTARNGDLKTSKTISTQNEKYLVLILNLIKQYECIVFPTILEKRFMITSLIVDNFFDPVYNIKLDNKWTYPIEIRKELSNFFYDKLPVELIKLAAIAFTKGNENDIIEFYKKIIKEAEYFQFKINIYDILKGVENNLTELSLSFDNEFKINSEFSIKSHTLRAPNFTTYYRLINLIELHLTNHNKSGSVVFDKTRQFDNAYIQLYKQLTKSKREIIDLNEFKLLFGFQHIKELLDENSDKLLGLQIADFIASSVLHIINIVENDKSNLTEFEKKLIQYFSALLSDNKVELIMSNKMIIKLVKMIKKYA